MFKKTTPSDLHIEVSKLLESYEKDIIDGVKKKARATAKHAAEKLQESSPEGNRGRYRKGWTSDVQKYEGHAVAYAVHNATDYQLTHLLENGHALRQGGWSPAKKHIKPVEQQANEEFEKGVEEVIKNAGR